MIKCSVCSATSVFIGASGKQATVACIACFEALKAENVILEKALQAATLSELEHWPSFCGENDVTLRVEYHLKNARELVEKID